jgi:hypothetical protein
MRKGLILVSLLGWIAGCGGSSGSGNGGGGGSNGGGGGTSGGVDMATTLVPPDLSTPADMSQLHCSDLLSNACQASQAAFNACFAGATASAKTMYNARITCVNNACNALTTDAGTGTCSTQDTCRACVQTGTSPTKVASALDPTCTDDGSDDATGNALCGICVDQVNACINDV